MSGFRSRNVKKNFWNRGPNHGPMNWNLQNRRFDKSFNNSAWEMNNSSGDSLNDRHYDSQIIPLVKSRFQESRWKNHPVHEERNPSLTTCRREYNFYERREYQQNAKCSRKLNKYRNQTVCPPGKAHSREFRFEKKTITDYRKLSYTSENFKEGERGNGGTSEKKDRDISGHVKEKAFCKKNDKVTVEEFSVHHSTCTNISVVSMDLGTDDEGSNNKKNKANEPGPKKKVKEDGKKVTATDKPTKIKKVNTAIVPDRHIETLKSPSDNAETPSASSADQIQARPSCMPAGKVANDPRLNKPSNHCRLIPSFPLQTKGPNILTDPRKKNLSTDKSKIAPLILRLPRFWLNWKQKLGMRRKNAKKPKSRDGTPIQAKSRPIRKRSVVCCNSINELRRHTKRPMKELLKFCCHVPIRKDECKYGRLETHSCADIQLLIDTGKSYLSLIKPKNDQEKKDNTERKGEDVKKDKKKIPDTAVPNKAKENIAKLKGNVARPHGPSGCKTDLIKQPIKRANPRKNNVKHEVFPKTVASQLKSRINSSFQEVYKISKDEVASDLKRAPVKRKLGDLAAEVDTKKKRDGPSCAAAPMNPARAVENEKKQQDMPSLEDATSQIQTPAAAVPSPGTGTSEASFSIDAIQDIVNGDKEYSLHLPEGDSTSNFQRMSSEELINALSDTIESIQSSTYSSDKAEEKSSSVSIENTSNEDEAVTEDTEKSRNVAPQNEDPSHSLEENDADVGLSFTDNDDEGSEILIQVRVTENPEVKVEEEVPPIMRVDLFGVQPEIKAEEQLETTPPAEGDRPVSDEVGNEVQGPDTTSPSVSEEVNTEVVTDRSAIQITKDSQKTNNVAEESGKAGSMESFNFTVPVYPFGTVAVSVSPVGGMNLGGAEQAPKNPEKQVSNSVICNGTKEAPRSQTKTVPVQSVTPTRSEHHSNPESRKEMGSSKVNLPGSNVTSNPTKPNDAPVNRNPMANSAAPRQTEATRPQIQMPALASIQDHTRAVSTSEVAHRMYKIMNSFILMIYRISYVHSNLKAMSEVFELEQDVSNLEVTISKVRLIYGSRLLECLRFLPPNLKTKNILFNSYMEFLSQMIQNPKSKPLMSKFVWALVELYADGYEENETLRCFKAFVQNDIRAQQHVSGRNITSEQYIHLRLQIFQYLRLLKSINSSRNRSQAFVEPCRNAARNTFTGSCQLPNSTQPRNMQIVGIPAAKTNELPIPNVTHGALFPPQVPIAQKQLNAVRRNPNPRPPPMPSSMHREVAVPPNVNQFVHQTTFGDTRGSTVENLPAYRIPLSGYASNPMKKNYDMSFPTNVNRQPLETNCSQPAKKKASNVQKTKRNDTMFKVDKNARNMPLNLALTEKSSSVASQGDSNRNVSDSPAVLGYGNQSQTIPAFNWCPNNSEQTKNADSLSRLSDLVGTQQYPAVSNPPTLPLTLPTQAQPSRIIYSSSEAPASSSSPITTPVCPYPTPPLSNGSQNLSPASTPEVSPIISSVKNAPSTLSENQNGTGEGSRTANPEISDKFLVLKNLLKTSPKVPEYSHQIRHHSIKIETTSIDLPSVKVPALGGRTAPEEAARPPPSPSVSSPPPSSISDGASLNTATQELKCHYSPISNPTSESETSSTLDLFAVKDDIVVDTSPVEICDDTDDEVVEVKCSDLTLFSEKSLALKEETDDIIDLTWLDDEEIKEESPEDQEDQPRKRMEMASLLIIHNRMCLCGDAAEYLCSCNSVMYCSQECQFKDWTNHQRVCPSAITLRQRVED